MGRRNSTDITAEILRLANGGAIKTQIVYGANLNFKIVRGYLSRLMELGLIEMRGRRGSYWTTDKGAAFLRHYEQLAKLGM